MGYTHYFNWGKKAPSQQTFNKIVADMKRIEDYCNSQPVHSLNAGGLYSDDEVKLFDWNGEKRGVEYDGVLQDGKFTCNTIRFNGDASEGLDHETMHLTLTSTGFNFCKTARKPYDLAVCLLLLCAKYHFKSMDVSSDGNTEDWEYAFKAFTELFPERKLPKLF